MKLICSSCGNFVHFETDVEMHQPVRQSVEGIHLEPRDSDGHDHQGSSVRMGIEEMVSFCVHNGLSSLEIKSHSGGAENRYISCARCGSRAVTIPYCNWSPPKPFENMDEELTANRREFAWLRKERAKHETIVPGLP